jgi:cullin-associated NEDD8-dissociated protein 1
MVGGNYTNISVHAISQLLPKLSDPDPDLRVMSLIDLNNIFEGCSINLLANEYNTGSAIVKNLLEVLDDSNAEVQNLALKW